MSQIASTEIEWKGRTGPFTILLNPGVFSPTHTSRTLADALEIESRRHGDRRRMRQRRAVVRRRASSAPASVIGCDLSEGPSRPRGRTRSASGWTTSCEFRAGDLLEPVRDVHATVLIGDVSGIPDEIAAESRAGSTTVPAGGPTGRGAPRRSSCSSIGDTLAARRAALPADRDDPGRAADPRRGARGLRRQHACPCSSASFRCPTSSRRSKAVDADDEGRPAEPPPAGQSRWLWQPPDLALHPSVASRFETQSPVAAPRPRARRSRPRGDGPRRRGRSPGRSGARPRPASQHLRGPPAPDDRSCSRPPSGRSTRPPASTTPSTCARVPYAFGSLRTTVTGSPVSSDTAATRSMAAPSGAPSSVRPRRASSFATSRATSRSRSGARQEPELVEVDGRGFPLDRTKSPWSSEASTMRRTRSSFSASRHAPGSIRRSMGWYSAFGRRVFFALPPETSHRSPAPCCGFPLPWPRIGRRRRRSGACEPRSPGFRSATRSAWRPGSTRRCARLAALGRARVRLRRRRHDHAAPRAAGTPRPRSPAYPTRARS